MRIFTDALLSALAAMGIYALFFALCAMGKKPLRLCEELTLTAVLNARCSAGELQHTVTDLMRLRAGGLADFDIVIADMGLDAQALRTAQLLTNEQGVALLTPCKENGQWTKEQANWKG